MEWFDVLMQVVSTLFVGALAFVGLGFIYNLLDIYKNKVKSQNLESDLVTLEAQVVTFIRAAEQKFNFVADIAEEFMTPEQKRLFQEHRRKANVDKKAYVLELAKQTFPDLDVKYIDAVIEGLYNAYKEAKERAKLEVS